MSTVCPCSRIKETLPHSLIFYFRVYIQDESNYHWLIIYGTKVNENCKQQLVGTKWCPQLLFPPWNSVTGRWLLVSLFRSITVTIIGWKKLNKIFKDHSLSTCLLTTKIFSEHCDENRQYWLINCNLWGKNQLLLDGFLFSFSFHNVLDHTGIWPPPFLNTFISYFLVRLKI